jgi:glucose/arabinose dehydrogenase
MMLGGKHIVKRIYFALLFLLVGCVGNEGINQIMVTPSKLAVSTAPLVPPAVEASPSVVIGASLSPNPIQTGSPTLVEPSATLAPITSMPTSTLSPVGIEDASGYTWQPVINGLNLPVGLYNAGDGTGRLFILEKAGVIRIFQNGSLLPRPFLDLTDRVYSGGLEQGLLGLAFHPEYRVNGYFYVNYIDLQGNTVIARFEVSKEDPNQAQAGSEFPLIRVDQPYANHNGGELVFGPDGYLYLGLGDGGSAGDPQNHAQSLDTLLGKILRIDVDHGNPYSIPSTNPYAQGGGRPEIFAYGLRNPWRFSFDSKTGDLYIADVGQNTWEEIDFLSNDQVTQTGRNQAYNFGWNFYEGNHIFHGEAPSGLEITFPVTEYEHQFGCSVTGGVVYRGLQLQDWQGIYLFGDYCSGRVWGLWQGPGGGWEQKELFENMGSITSFGVDEQGEIYLLDQSGIIYRLVAK